MREISRYIIQWLLTGALILGLGYFAFNYEGLGYFFTGYGVVVCGVLCFFFLNWVLHDDDEKEEEENVE